MKKVLPVLAVAGALLATTGTAAEARPAGQHNPGQKMVKVCVWRGGGPTTNGAILHCWWQRK